MRQTPKCAGFLSEKVVVVVLKKLCHHKTFSIVNKSET